MTRTVMIIGLVAMFLVAIGTPSLSVTSASAAEMMQADKSMHKATGDELMNLRQELAIIQAELQKLSARVGGMMHTAERATSNYCKSIPKSLGRSQFAPGICQ